MLKKLFYLSFLFLVNLYLFSDTYLSTRYDFYYNTISGPGKYQSYLSEGKKYNYFIQLYNGENIQNFSYNINFAMRSTDDKKYELAYYSLDNFKLKLNYYNNYLTLGDVFEYFSQYTLNTPIKGINLFLDNEFFNVNVIYGFGYQRWDAWYGDSTQRTMRRNVIAGKIKFHLHESLWIASNANYSYDDESTRVNYYESSYDNKVFSQEIEFNPFEGVILYSEAAYAKTNLIPQLNLEKIYKEGYATKVRLTLDGEPIWSTHEYERTMPEFYAILGSVIQDREKVSTNWKFKITKDLWLKTNFMWYKDNLGNSKSYTTEVLTPNVIFTIKRLFNDDYFNLDLNYRYDLRNGGEFPSTNHTAGINYSDRFFVIDSTFDLSYTRYEIIDLKRSNDINYNAILSNRMNFDIFSLSPKFNIIGWYSYDEITKLINKSNELSGELTLDITVLNILLSGNYGYGVYEIDKEKSIKNYWGINFNTFIFQNITSSLKYLFNSYDFNTLDNNGNERDYTETSFIFNVSISF